MFRFDKKYFSKYNIIAGVDEAGRGPLAGPVVAAAVVFDKNVFINGINDSKKLSAKKRETLFDEIISTEVLQCKIKYKNMQVLAEYYGNMFRVKYTNT